MGGKKAPETRMPTAAEIGPLIDLQAQYNRVGVRTPFGEQRYEVGPDGRSSTMVTDIGPEGQALVGRAVGLGMTDSARMQVPNQINGLAQALANRVGSRFGMAPEQGMQLASSNNQVQTPAKPESRAPSMPSAGASTGPTLGGNRGQGGGAAQPHQMGGGRGFADVLRAHAQRKQDEAPYLK